MSQEKEDMLAQEQQEDVVNNSDVAEQTNKEEIVEQKSNETLEIERLQAENDALADKVLRAQAELQNIQKRQAKERSDLLRYSAQRLGTALLPAIDSLERALAIEVDNDQAVALQKGVDMAYNSFLAALKEVGIEPIKAVDEKFDPTLHQAIQQVALEGVESDIVTQEFQKGYKLHDRVLRPSMVVVSQ